MSSSTWQDCYNSATKSMRVKWYLTAASRRARSYLEAAEKVLRRTSLQCLLFDYHKQADFLLSSSIWQGCHIYYQRCSCQVVPDKADKTLQQKYACQVVPDKAVKTLQQKVGVSSGTWQGCFTSYQNNLIKQYLTSLFYLLSKTILSSSTWQGCFTYCRKQSCQVVSDKADKTLQQK